MALSALTISVSSGVQGRSFKSAVSGFVASNIVEVIGGSSGFGYSNGFLTHNGLPADTNLAILRERNPVTGENLTTNLIITAASAYTVAQKASALDATYKTYRIAPITQGDGSQIWNVFTDGQVGGTLNTPVNGPTVISISGTPPAATVGVAYSFTPTTANGSGTKTFSYTGTVLSGFGLSFSTTTGAITGTPTTNGTITGTIGVSDSSGTASPPLGISIAVAAAPVTLSALTLSPLTATAGSAYTGTISGKTTGSTITATSSDGTTLGVSGTTVTGTFAGAGSPTITLTENLSGATNDGRQSTGTMVVSSSVVLGTLTLSGSLQNGTAASGSIIGATTGSTIACNIPGITVNSGARTYSGTPTAMGTYANGLVETLTGATNTPHNSSFTVSAAALPLTGNLAERWSADDIPAQSDNTNLPAWVGSIAGLSAAQATTAQQPKYRTSQLGGKPGVQFAGSMVLDGGRPAAITGPMDAKTYTMVVIASNIQTVANGTLAGMSNISSLLLQGTGVRVGTYTGGNASLWPFATSAPVVLGYVSYPTAATLGSSSIAAFVYANSTAFVGTNGGLLSGTSNFAIGGFANNTFTAKAVIYEVLFWNASLSPANMIQLQKWFCDKYGQAYPWAASNKYYVFHGDSITSGQNKDAPEVSYPSIVAELNGLPLGTWTNFGLTGTTLVQMQTVSGAMVDAIPVALGSNVTCILSAFEWYNTRASAPATSTISSANTYLAARKSANPSIKIAWGTSTNSSDTATETGRQAYDTNFDSNHAPSNNIDGYFAIHNDATIGQPGTYSNTTYFAADGVHLTGHVGYPATPSGYYSLAAVAAPVIAAL